MRYLCLLRGINVSGQKKIIMKELVTVIAGAGFDNVETYLQSGNLLLDSELNAEQIESSVQSTIQNHYSYENVDVLVMNQHYLQEVLAGVPGFAEHLDMSKLSMTFLKGSVDPALLALMDGDEYLPDRFVISGNVVYVYHPNGYGRIKINNNYFERKLKLRATTRNHRSVSTLLEKIKPSTG